MQPQDEPPFDTKEERAPPDQTVGAALRAARLRLGSELTEVAAILRIRAPFLQAIEDGQFQALPGLPYAIGFVRTYAEHLGLDGPEMVRRFKSEAAGLERKTSLSFPTPPPEGRVPGTTALLVSLVALTVVFTGWYFYQGGTERLVPRVPEVPERLANPSSSVPAFNVGGLGETPADPASTGASTPLPPTPGPSVAATAAAPVAPVPAAAPAIAVSPPPALGTDAALPPPPGDPTRRLAAVPPPVAATSPAAVVPPPVAATAPPPSLAAAAPAEAEDGPPPD
ncbi:MAG: helix-turn-helix domain-containing protein, partial [Proteobacteria bacterium]|nr:helix-turn-helix domain-containing protein [Pseudomonadota bacterium]